MLQVRNLTTAAAAALLLTAFAAPAAQAGEASAPASGQREIHVVKVHCDAADGDCADAASSKVVFIGEDGVPHEIGDGGDWVAAGDAANGAKMKVMFIGEDGVPHEIGGDGLTWTSDGEGAAAGKMKAKAIFVGEDGEPHEVGGDGFAWTSESGAPFVFRLGESGPMLGVALTPLTAELRAHFGVPEDAGVMVSSVVEGSAAWKAGLQAGDILTSIDGDTVASAGDLAGAVRSHKAGDVVALGRWRDGAFDTLTATLEEGQAAAAAGPGHEVRKIVINCEEGDEDCDIGDHLAFDCAGAGECEIRVQCQDGACDCNVNGESVDCATIPGAGALADK